MGKRRFGRYIVETSNEDKLLFPGDGISKGDLIDYYVAVADTMLPHLEGRPLSMQRFPDGIDEPGFYQKEAPDYFPDWIERVRIGTADGTQQQIVCRNAATLAYLAQQACITPHVWLSKTGRLERPDRLVLDLDPPDDDFDAVRAAAGQARALLDGLGLPVFVMTTGSRGAHLVIPLDGREKYDTVRELARDLAQQLAMQHKDTLTIAQKKKDRGNRVYLDTGNNAYGQTTVAPYAVRARPGAPVATPITWEEFGDGRTDARRWNFRSIARRLAQRDDPWRDIARHACSLRDARSKLERRRR